MTFPNTVTAWISSVTIGIDQRNFDETHQIVMQMDLYLKV